MERCVISIHIVKEDFAMARVQIARFSENRVDEVRHHADLLRRMQLEIQGIRPALL